MKTGIANAAPPLALLAGLLIVVASLYPVLAPLLDADMVFAKGDFSTIGGNDSGAKRAEYTLSTFSDGSGRRDTNRFFLLGGLSALSGWIAFSDTQFNSALILLSTILGSLGIYGIVRRFSNDWRYASFLLLVLVPFYYLNLWSIERMGHIWIWFSFAVFPLPASLGLSFIEGHRFSRLVMYSLLISCWGFVPHNFIYMMVIHCFLVSYSWLSGARRADILKLALFPLLIYSLLSTPLLALIGVNAAEYPQKVTQYSFTYLSRYGEFSSLLSFSNNWWPSISEEVIHSNQIFRYSSYGISIAALSVFALAYGNAGKRGKEAMLLSLLFLFIVMFIAQGANNDIVGSVAGNLVDAGLGLFVGPFREWARISILIPLFMVIVFSAGLEAVPKKPIVALAIAALVAVNIGSGPQWRYLDRVHSAVTISEDYGRLEALIADESKVLWNNLGKAFPATALDGTPDRVRPPLTPSAGSAYTGWGFIGREQARNMPQAMMEAFNIHHVVDLKDEKNGFPWLECVPLETVMLCSDNKAPEPFRVYDGSVLADGSRVLSLMHVLGGRLAPCEQDCPNAGIALMERGSPAPESGQLAAYVLEAEGDMAGKKKELSSPGSSNNTVVAIRNATLGKDIVIMRSGTYMLAMKAKGNLSAYVNGRKLLEGEHDGSFSYSEPFFLPEGKVRILAECNGTGELDVIWLYEALSNRSIESLFATNQPAPAKVLSYERISPTRWIATIDSSGPFLLGFAEAYSTEWEASVYQDGTLVETLSPIRTFGALNGYWLNRSGRLDIELRYKPQDGFEMGWAITYCVFAACFAYLAYALLGGERNGS